MSRLFPTLSPRNRKLAGILAMAMIALICHAIAEKTLAQEKIHWSSLQHWRCKTSRQSLSTTMPPHARGCSPNARTS